MRLPKGTSVAVGGVHACGREIGAPGGASDEACARTRPLGAAARRRLRTIAGFGLALALLGGAPADLAIAAPPEGLPPPPIEDGDGGDDAGVQADAALDAERARLLAEQQRMLEFTDHLKKASKSERDGRYNDAAKEYAAALRLQEDDPEALRGLAHARKRTTPAGKCPRHAVENLLLLQVHDPAGLWLDERGQALTWMADCGEVYSEERLKLALELASMAPGTRGRPEDARLVAGSLLWEQAQRSKRADKQRNARRQSAQQLARYIEETDAGGRVPDAQAIWLLAEIERESGEDDKALEHYRAFIAANPSDERAAAARGYVHEIETRRRVNELDQSQGGLPTPTAEAAYRAGLLSLRNGSLRAAQAYLERAIAESPWYREPYYVLGEVHARRRNLPEAIEAWTTYAAAMPYDDRVHSALGMLYFHEFRGSQDDKAKHHLERALRLRPDLNALHYYLGELLARSDKEAARAHLSAFIESEPDSNPLVPRARDALRKLEGDPGSEDILLPPPPPDELRSLAPELQRLINEAYVVGAENGEWDRAERILLRANEQFPGQPAVLNELAKVAAAQGRVGEARTYWEESLRINDAQLEVHERLGLAVPDAAIALEHLRRAADLGSTMARFELARRLWAGYRAWDASRELDIYLAEAGPYDLSWERALMLRDEIDRALWQIYVAAVLALLLVLVVPSIRVYRTLRGASLRQLLARAPKSFPEVARILSLIRHEILKHNTAFLADVGHALEVDALDADARARLLARRLFGGPGDVIDRPGERQGIYGRFLGYCEELERVARSHGVTLNLARKDPVFSAMLRAFEAVARRARWLRDPQSLDAARRLELSRILHRSGHVLGREAFDRLSATIQSLCVVEVDDALVRGCFAKVRSEHQFAGADIADLEIASSLELAARVRIFRTDLEDVLVNVIRNSLASSLQFGVPPAEIGIELATETDDITGMSSLAIRIKDRSPEPLTNEMLRGRYVERGMGITADLLSRYDGSIAVEAEPGWNKAVVLRFFLIEHAA